MRALPVAALLVLSSCGYTLANRAADGSDHAISVPAIREPGIDVDAGASVLRAVRTAVARTPGLRLVQDGDETYELRVEVLSVDSNLAPFAEPALRAAQYLVRITLRGTVRDVVTGKVLATPVVQGESRYLSTPGGVETIDGANRRTIERAAIEAADRLMLNVRATLAGR